MGGKDGGKITRVTVELEARPPAPRSRWETIIWPRWLPVRARLPLIAQITGGCALFAALAMPRWTEVAQVPAAEQAAIIPQASLDPQASLELQAVIDPPRPVVPRTPRRPAHLNLDVRHTFRSVDLSVSVDGARVLDTRLEGSGKRFGMFGKRAEKGYTKSLNLSPGVRVVRVRVRSAADKFDQTRTERFDLDSAAVAALQIEADKSGISVVAERPPALEQPAAAPVTQLAPVAQVAPATQVAQATQATQVVQAAQAQQASALAELYQALRSILIAVAGFVGSAATGYVVQEFLRSRKGLLGH